MTVDEADVARAPVDVTCARCGETRIVTKSGRSIAPPKHVAADEPLDLVALAEADDGRLPDLASIAAQSEAGRVSRVPLDELIDVPPSVRATIRASLPPAPPSAPEAVSASDQLDSVSPGRRPRPGKLAVGLAAVAVIAAVAIGHLSVSSEAAGVERVVATPFTPAPHGPVTPAEIVGGAQSSSLFTAESSAPATTAAVAPLPPKHAAKRDAAKAGPAPRSTGSEHGPASSSTATPAPSSGSELMRAMENSVHARR